MINKVKEEIEYVLSTYSFYFKYELTESYFEGKAVTVSITPNYRPNVTFELHVEKGTQTNTDFMFEQGEDNWEDLSEEELFKWMYWEALEKIPNN